MQVIILVDTIDMIQWQKVLEVNFINLAKVAHEKPLILDINKQTSRMFCDIQSVNNIPFASEASIRPIFHS